MIRTATAWIALVKYEDGELVLYRCTAAPVRLGDKVMARR